MVTVELDLVLPDHGGRCVSSIIPAVVSGWATDVVPDEVLRAPAVVVLVVDGLGWHQLMRHAERAPVLTGAAGSPITTGAPSTTAAALTSISTGAPPGEHGVVGYRIRTSDGVLNCLRWTTPGGDARRSLPPDAFQPIEPFLGAAPPVVTKAEFRDTGFTDAHLRGGSWHGWWTPFTLVSEVVACVERGERIVYSYYDGLDKVGHVYGIGDEYGVELDGIDRMVGQLLDALPAGTELLVTADHGMVHVGDSLVELAPDVLSGVASTSGEARFMWLHTRQGAADDVAAAAGSAHGDVGWVAAIEQVLDENWFGHSVRHEARERLGDVALVAREPIGFVEPATPEMSWLVGRHGGLTAEEMHVPLVRLTAG